MYSTVRIITDNIAKRLLLSKGGGPSPVSLKVENTQLPYYITVLLSLYNSVTKLKVGSGLLIEASNS